MNTLKMYKVDKRTGKPRQTSFNKMEAIACGVQARFEESTGYTKKVTDETINVARALGVPESEIEKWASYRLRRIAIETTRLKEIKAYLDRLYDNPLGA